MTRPADAETLLSRAEDVIRGALIVVPQAEVRDAALVALDSLVAELSELTILALKWRIRSDHAEAEVNAICRDFDELREAEQILEAARQPVSEAALVAIAVAADRYMNWHQERIVPTESIPDQYAAMRELRSVLDALPNAAMDAIHGLIEADLDSDDLAARRILREGEWPFSHAYIAPLEALRTGDLPEVPKRRFPLRQCEKCGEWERIEGDGIIHAPGCAPQTKSEGRP